MNVCSHVSPHRKSSANQPAKLCEDIAKDNHTGSSDHMVPWLLKQQHATQCSTMQHHATSCNNNRNTWAALRFACYGSSPHMPKIDPGCNYPQGFGIGVLYMQMAIHLCRLYKNHCRQKFACAILYKVARSQHVSLASLAPVQNISKYYRILQNGCLDLAGAHVFSCIF